MPAVAKREMPVNRGMEMDKKEMRMAITGPIPDIFRDVARKAKGKVRKRSVKDTDGVDAA